MFEMISGEICKLTSTEVGGWEGVERRHLETLGEGGLETGRPREW